MPRKKNQSSGDNSLPANKQKKCSDCHMDKQIKEFYISKNPIFSVDGRVPICKDCIIKKSLNEDGTINELELNKILKKIDRPYYKDLLESSIKSFKKEHSYIENDSIKYYGKEILQKYFTLIAMRQDRDKSYEDSEKEGFIHQKSNTPKSTKEKIAQKYADINNAKRDKSNFEKNIFMQSNKIEWSIQDIQNKDYAIEIIGYDPFIGYPEGDRRFLFNQLAPYLEDEDIADDAYKLSQILQIVDNNKQIRQCDVKIANLDPIEDAENIKLLNSIKKDLVQSNDKIAKENEISVKNRSNKDMGKSTLTYLMRDLRSKNFDKAEADYYDQLKSAGTRWAVNMSITSIVQNGIFDENEKKEVYEMQLNLIDKLNQELDECKEKIRILLLQIDQLKAGIINNE